MTFALPTQVCAGEVITVDFEVKEGVHQLPGREMWADVDDEATGVTRVPAFWRGGRRWAFRYSSLVEGQRTFRLGLESSSGKISPLVSGQINVVGGPIHMRPLEIDLTTRRFVRSGGSHFLWLADTLWMGLTGRVNDEEFQEIVHDRAQKGFTVLQVVAGLPPDAKTFEDWTANSGGFSWERDLSTLNPGFYEIVDRRLQILMDAGMVPCIFGAWGFYLSRLGVGRMRSHWRNLVARYWAYPVLWCLAGEALMPDLTDIGTDQAIGAMDALGEGWLAIAQEVRQIDPGRRPISAHPSIAMGHYSTEDMFPDSNLFDFVMLQTGHSDKNSLAFSLSQLERALDQTAGPVINSEVCYEGIMGSNWQDTQRFLVWTNLLGGAAGHTYGAQGVWGLDRAEDGGASPGYRWGQADWRAAMTLPGSAQVGHAARLLNSLDWSNFEPHLEWVKPHATPKEPFLPRAAGISSSTRVIYFPSTSLLPAPGQTPGTVGPDACISRALGQITLCELEPGNAYRAYYVNPRSGSSLPEFFLTADERGCFDLTPDFINANPTLEDWVMVVQPNRTSSQ